MNFTSRLRAAMRLFITGNADITGMNASYGYTPDDYQPASYVTYLAASNAVYACSRLRAETLASLPIRLYRGARDSKKEVTTGVLYDLLHKVNDHWTMQRLLSMHEYSMCTWGEDYWFLERGQAGRLPPREIWWGRADRMTVYPHPVDYIASYDYRPFDGADEIHYTPGEVICFRYANPANQFRGLSPLAAARLSADTASAAMLSNRQIFANGVQMGGMITPKSGKFTEEQAKQIEEDIARRFKGADKAHRIGVFRFEAELKSVGITPKDAEFLGMLKWTLEDVARAYGVPLDLIGGQRTYENVNAAMLALWTQTIIPEKRMVEAELTEQLLPMFPGQADSVEMDTSDVSVLKDDDAAAWVMASGQLDKGAITINEWREQQGLKPVAWGTVWWGPMALTPIFKDPIKAPLPPLAPKVIIAPPTSALGEAESQPPPEASAEIGAQASEAGTPRSRAPDDPSWAYGGTAHQARWQAFVRSTEALEKKFTLVVQDLFRRQQDAVLARLKGRAARAPGDVVDEPFDMARWVKEFRVTVRVILEQIMAEGGAEVLNALGLLMSFDVNDPRVRRFLEQRAQRFAVEVNATTWDALTANLAEGIDAGESIPMLAAHVEAVMGDRIQSTPETIARTEVIGAYNGGTLEAWKQSGVVTKKRWLAALDDRTRETHIAAHDQVVGIDEDFAVGDGAGPCPGSIGLPEEDINCRCSMTAVVDILDKGK